MTNSYDCYLLLLFIKILLYTQILQNCDNKHKGIKLIRMVKEEFVCMCV